MNTKHLVGCINHIKPFGVIKTRFFFIDSEIEEIKDVTIELCDIISQFNAQAKELRLRTGQYSLVIPYEYKNGIAEYSHGCGLAHYLQEENFEDLIAVAPKFLSFPLQQCKMTMYTLSDVKNILNCKNVFDTKIINALKDRHFKEKQKVK
jgi:hypothetical protein